MAPALSVINFSIEQSTVPQITHKRSENLAASGNCLGCIINIAWYLQEKRGILQEMLHTKDFVCRKSLKDFNGYCSPSTSLYYISLPLGFVNKDDRHRHQRDHLVGRLTIVHQDNRRRRPFISSTRVGSRGGWREINCCRVFMFQTFLSLNYSLCSTSSQTRV